MAPDIICFMCESKNVIWNSDYNSEECGREAEGIVSIWHCADYGCEYEVFIPEEPLFEEAQT